MSANNCTRLASPSGESRPLLAGDFSSWLAGTRRALIDNRGTDVACDGCVGCCSSSYFIHIRRDESQILTRLPRESLAPAPGMGDGAMVMGYDERGRCPMLGESGCAIYAHRPGTCRAYDCRLFAAAGILAGGADKAAINQRIERWEFGYPSPGDRREHEAVKAAATFIRRHPSAFPGGRVPDNPSQLAVLAIKVYAVFMGGDGGRREPADRPASELAREVIAACRSFDAAMSPCMP